MTPSHGVGRGSIPPLSTKSKNMKIRTDKQTPLTENEEQITASVEIAVDGFYRYPMTAESLAEDKAHSAENKRRKQAGEALLPPLPPTPRGTPIKYYVVDKNK